MTIAWINLSTRWSLLSVQAALNVIISVLGTIGIWAFSRFWWQRGTANIISRKSEVPLSALFTLSGPGEGWDVVTMLRRRVFARENWHLLVQVFVVIAVTFACMFSGPIAKVSLKNGRTIHQSELRVLQTTKGDGFGGSMINAEVLWNDTIQSLNKAEFPMDQILDYLPPSTAPWAYTASEWNPTWSMTCNYTAETVVQNVTASGNHTFYEPLDAFPAYRDTYHPSWLNASKYRVQADFDSWQVVADQNSSDPFKLAFFFILIQSDPEIDNRMYTNNETLQISLSIFRAQDFGVANYQDVGEEAATLWRPMGPIHNASFARTECNITRKPEVRNESSIPWIWTNDTYSITLAYQTYWIYTLEEAGSKALSLAVPSPEDILRFYQTYMATVNTLYASPFPRDVSVWMDTVQVSTAFLVMVIILAATTAWLTLRYFIFRKRNKAKLKEIYVPDGKIEWMVHAAKISTIGEEEKTVEGKRAKDRDHFRMATFGCGHLYSDFSDDGLKHPGPARVYTTRGSVSGSVHSSIRGLASRGSVSKDTLGRRPVEPTVIQSKEDGQELKFTPCSTNSHTGIELSVHSAGDDSTSGSRDHSRDRNAKTLRPKTLRKSSTDGNSPNVGFRSIVPEMEERSCPDDDCDDYDNPTSTSSLKR